MFFVIKSLNNFFNVFFKNLVFLKDQFYTLIFFRPIESFTKKWNPKSFTNYFKSQSFSANYIFHWNKLPLVNDKSPHINDLNTNTSYMIHKPRLESFSKKYYTDLLEVLFYSKHFITTCQNLLKRRSQRWRRRGTMKRGRLRKQKTSGRNKNAGI